MPGRNEHDEVGPCLYVYIYSSLVINPCEILLVLSQKVEETQPTLSEHMEKTMVFLLIIFGTYPPVN